MRTAQVRTRAVVLLSSLRGLHAYSNNGGVRPPDTPAACPQLRSLTRVQDLTRKNLPSSGV
jgi:hypothetical protein